MANILHDVGTWEVKRLCSWSISSGTPDPTARSYTVATSVNLEPSTLQINMASRDYGNNFNRTLMHAREEGIIDRDERKIENG